MCKYCKGVILVDDVKYVVVNPDMVATTVSFNFCPVCGRDMRAYKESKNESQEKR